MKTDVLILNGVAVVTLALTYWFYPSVAGRGIRSAWGMLGVSLPRIIPGFIVAGIVLAAVPREFFMYWMGAESGWRGLAIAMGLGIITPGVPSVQFPMLLALVEAGVGPGPMATYITSWALLGLSRVLVFDVPFLGLQFTAARMAASLLVPLLVGALCGYALSAEPPPESPEVPIDCPSSQGA